MAACQKKQYFTSSPEIDMVKKGNEAYFKGDWETLRSNYANDAIIYDNHWDSTKTLTPDQIIEQFKKGLANFTEYRMGDNVNEMIVTDTGEKWVHSWFIWIGKTKEGKEASTPVNVSFLVKDNKIAMQVNIFNALPGYLASLPTDPLATAP